VQLVHTVLAFSLRKFTAKIAYFLIKIYPLAEVSISVLLNLLNFYESFELLVHH